MRLLNRIGEALWRMLAHGVGALDAATHPHVIVDLTESHLVYRCPFAVGVELRSVWRHMKYVCRACATDISVEALDFAERRFDQEGER